MRAVRSFLNPEALSTILDQLAEGGITSCERDSPSDRNAAVAQTLQLSLKRLTAAEQGHHQALGPNQRQT